MHIFVFDIVFLVFEQYNNCNLNPNSLNYIARKIGDSRERWDQTERRYVREGNYPNNSQYIYVDVNSDVDAGITNPVLLPFGFEGIAKYDDIDSSFNSTTVSWLSASNVEFRSAGVGLGVGNPGLYTSGSLFVISSSAGAAEPFTDCTASVDMPRPVVRLLATDGNLANPTDAYFGLQTTRTVGSTVYDRSTIDLLRPRGGLVGQRATDTTLSASLSPLSHIHL